MQKIDKLGSAKRFGARYGTKTKHKFAKIEREQRRKHKCPYCNNVKVKRVAVGIWHCRKCDSKFTGKAYSVKKTIVVEESTTEEKAKEPISKEKLQEETK
ncbi:50S ribosomal protein L37ae [archaeon AH-315-M20]|nr:50S ribosomal protein L37ae [archaeon AH-315-M20]